MSTDGGALPTTKDSEVLRELDTAMMSVKKHLLTVFAQVNKARQQNVVDRQQIEADRRALEEERKVVHEREEARRQEEFERKKAEEERRIENPDEIIEVNVGGENFTTTRKTLCIFHRTRLYELFSGEWTGPRTKDGRIFLDRDPKYFALILSFLRNPKAEIELAKKDIRNFQKEAEWFGLTEVMFV
jgi:hypothetical protein